MADLFLHLPFARRLRFAEGMHPLAGEAIGRRPALVVLGAALAGLPENERRGMSWLRRLFSGGGEAARWQKLLAPTPGQPHVELLLQLLVAEDAAVGPLARLALGIGVLSHELLEEKVGALTSTQPGPQRAAIERAQARLWLQSAVPGHLEHEWRPVLESDASTSEATRRALTHIDRALKRVHGAAPGEPALARWLKGLAAEVGPLVDGKGPTGAMPPPLSVQDHDARGPHFDAVSFIEKSQGAVSTVVHVANRLGEAFTKGNPDKAALTDALAKLKEPLSSDIEPARVRWKEWLQTIKEAALTRGRNPKPAYIEGETPIAEQRLGSITKVMSLADLPPETEAAGAPPMPEASGPMPRAPSQTQEVSLSQIEAESHAAGFQAPAHTQEVSVAQIEGEDPAKITQPISMAQIEAANAEDEALKKPPPAPTTEPPTSTHPDAHAENGANGVPKPAAEGEAAATKPAQPEEPPRE